MFFDEQNFSKKSTEKLERLKEKMNLKNKSNRNISNITMTGNGSTVTVNGQTYTGNNISVVDGKVIIDGKEQEELDSNKIEITVLCNVEKIISDETINIKGNVTGNVEAKVNVNCDDVYGNVNAGMNVNSDDIEGNAIAGMTINCDKVYGDVTANKINR